MRLLYFFLLIFCMKNSFSQNCPGNMRNLRFSTNTQIALYACIDREITFDKQEILWGIKNNTPNKLRIIFDKEIKLTCGNTLTSRADITLKGYASKGGGTFIGDDVDLSDKVFSENCKRWDNRIQSIMVKNLRIIDESLNERLAQQKKTDEEYRQMEIARSQAEQRQKEQQLLNLRRQEEERFRLQRINFDQKIKAQEALANENYRIIANQSADVLLNQANSSRDFSNSLSKILGTGPDPISEASANNIEALSNLARSLPKNSNSSYGGSVQLQDNSSVVNSVILGAATLFASSLDSKRRMEESRRERELEEERLIQEQLNLEQQTYQRAQYERNLVQQQQQVEFINNRLLEERQAKERAIRQEAEIKKNLEAANLKMMMSLLLTTFPSNTQMLKEVFYLPIRIDESTIEVCTSPIKVSKTVLNKWPTKQLLSSFLRYSILNTEVNDGVNFSGFYATKALADKALQNITRLSSQLGLLQRQKTFYLDEKSLNKYLIDQVNLEKKKNEMERRNALIEKIKISSIGFNYPKSNSEFDNTSFLVVSYTNDLDSFKVGISKLINVYKYSDGTWPLRIDFEKRLSEKVTDLDFKNYFIIGYTSKEKIIEMIRIIRNTFIKNKLITKDIDLDLNFNNNSINLNNDFWN
jgi:hypothetical protein